MMYGRTSMHLGEKCQCFFEKIHYCELTLHTEAVGAVLRLQHQPLAVPPSVLGRRVVALPPPPLGALRPTGGPLAPVCPHAVH